VEGVAVVVGGSYGVGVGGWRHFWVAVGGCGWLKNNHCRLRQGIYYSFFLISTDCRNCRSLIFTDSVSRKFKIKIYASYGLHKL